MATVAIYFLYDSLSIAPSVDNYYLESSGTYEVISWLNNCARTDQVVYTIEDCEVYLDYSNIFIPNGDHSNDTFCPQSHKNISSARLFIYNRWGKEVFLSENLDQTWEGTNESEGMYYYICNYQDRFGNEGFIRGWILLER